MRFGRGTCGDRRVTATESAKTELAAPDDDFYLEDDYRERFGDWRKNGHQRMVVGGQRGVAVPATKQPYKLRRIWQSGIEMSEVMAETCNEDHVFGVRKLQHSTKHGGDLTNAHTARVGGLSAEQ